MINELPLVDMSGFWMWEKETYRQAIASRRKWTDLIFLAIGGLYTNFRTNKETSYVINNKYIHFYVLDRVAANNELTFCIHIKDKKSTSSFCTTNIKKMELFFWKHCISN